MGACLLGALLAGGLIGAAIDWGLRALGLNTIPSIVAVFGAGAGAVVFAFGLRAVSAWLQRIWKRRTMRHFGLAHLPVERFKLAVVLFEPDGMPWSKNVKLLAETEDALVFLGRQPAIRVIRISDIAEMGWHGFSGAWWIIFKLRDESIVCMMIMEDGAMVWGHSAATRAVGDRIYAKIHPSEAQ